MTDARSSSDSLQHIERGAQPGQAGRHGEEKARPLTAHERRAWCLRVQFVAVQMPPHIAAPTIR